MKRIKKFDEKGECIVNYNMFIFFFMNDGYMVIFFKCRVYIVFVLNFSYFLFVFSSMLFIYIGK